MARGKNTTVKTILSNVRVKTGTVLNDRLTETMLLDLLNFRVGEIAKKLVAINHPFYIEDATLTLSGSVYPISAVDPPVERIVKLVDSSLGLIKFVSADEFERASSFANLYANTLLAVQEGEEIRVFKGSGLGSHGTIKLYYIRQLEDASSTAAYPDVPDSLTSLLTKMICSDVYGYLGKENALLEEDIAKSLSEIKEGFLLEAA